ncbi:hypothetical protein OPV22_030537 [Ensete ventricosum]|uniref:Uncharacterized protein n=1 Tax=Ensete ventricosum TaxID=4639 RepID=A0AAV8Q0G2_ENSVE|nr:hypothetical protein OPV22_030537 [Ensete ventricosum]
MRAASITFRVARSRSSRAKATVGWRCISPGSDGPHRKPLASVAIIPPPPPRSSSRSSMDSILLDQSQVNPGKVSLDVAANSGGRFVPRAIHGSLSSYASLSQLLPDHHATVGGFRSCVSRPVQPPQRQLLYASLPSSFCADLMGGVPPPRHHHLPPLPPLQQPPLLPLPLTKSATLPPSPKVTRTNTGAGMARSRDHRSKPKPWASSKKESQPSSKAAGQPREPKDEPHKTTRVIVSNNGEGKEEEEEEVYMESIYSLSPPPANLPLPSFLLTRHRAACNTQVIIDGGAGGRG